MKLINGRVGRRRTPWEPYLGPHSDTATECNYNGEHVLNLCAEYQLFVTNTFYQHKLSQVYTWYRWNDLQTASQIDFILTRIAKRPQIRDSRAIPNAGLDTDHRPVILSLGDPQKRRMKKKEKQVEQINLRKLQDEEIKAKVQADITLRLQDISPDSMNVEETWKVFKGSVLLVLEEHCGKKKTGKSKGKATSWWNETVKAAVKEKKRLYKVWVKSKRDEDYENYRVARRACKTTVQAAKDQSWKQYGEDLSELCRRSPREFYKSVKAMRLRDEPHDPTTVINDKEGQPLYDDTEIRDRWEEYFRQLLNPVEGQQDQPTFTPRYQEHKEPVILESEVRQAVKISPRNKAAGVDGITTEVILACGEIGIQWLTTIF